MEAQEPVSIYTVNTPTEAQMVRNALAAEGIAAEISGDDQAGLAGVLTIDVLVKAVDADRARAVIAGLQADHLEEDEDITDAGPPEDPA